MPIINNINLVGNVDAKSVEINLGNLDVYLHAKNQLHL